jgi:hypothetical protein
MCIHSNEVIDNPTTRNDMDVNNIIRRWEAKGGKMIGEEDGRIMEAKDGRTTVTTTTITTSKVTSKTSKRMEIPCVFCYMEDGHLRKVCLVWKCVYEEDARNVKSKVGVNVVMVKWN